MSTRKILAASAVLNISLAALLVFYWKTPAATAPAAVATVLVPSHTLASSSASASNPQFLHAARAAEAASPLLSTPAAPVPAPPIVATVTSAPEIRFVATRSEPISNSQPTQNLASQSSASLPQESEGIAVDSSRPGNAIHFRGMRVAVATNYGTNNVGQPTLAVDVTPETGSTGDASTNGSGAGSAASSSNSLGSNARLASTDLSSPPPVSATTDPTAVKKSRLRVFSDEDNAARTAWGWAAWDQMQREAAAGSTN